MANDAEKEVAAKASLKYVHDGQIVGLGTGSTATIAIRLLGERVQKGLSIRGIPTSIASRDLATQLGIPLITFEEAQQIDVTIDGADEFDPALNLIKGGGGAMLREKIVASATRQLVIVTDSSKQVPVLGKFPLPVEVIGFAEPLLARKLPVSARKSPDARMHPASPTLPMKATTSSTADSARFRTRRPWPERSARCRASSSTDSSWGWRASC